MLSYVAQLCFPTEDALKAKICALRTIFKGPADWVKPIDLFKCNTAANMPIKVPSLQAVSHSSMLRVAWAEKLDFQELFKDFNAAFIEAIGPKLVGATWLNKSFAHNLRRAENDLAYKKSAEKTWKDLFSLW